MRELPTPEFAKGIPVIRRDKFKLELLTWLGRGIVDLAALGGELPDLTEEMTDVLSHRSARS